MLNAALNVIKVNNTEAEWCNFTSILCLYCQLETYSAEHLEYLIIFLILIIINYIRIFY